MPMRFVLAAFAIAAAPAAAETYSLDLTGFGRSMDFFEALSGDLIVVHNHFDIDTYEGLDGTPMEGITSRCFGSMTILRGVPRGGGNCVFTDPNGDQILQSWDIDSAESDKAFGNWYLVGGTGIHEGVTGRGSYEARINYIAGTTETKIIGTATWPE